MMKVNRFAALGAVALKAQKAGKAKPAATPAPDMAPTVEVDTGQPLPAPEAKTSRLAMSTAWPAAPAPQASP